MCALKISVITPSYNQGKFIDRTISSILNQSYKNVEHIIIDAKSTDQTLTILKKYGKKITWISEKDNGQADAINKGLHMATGDIVTYLNSDDYYLPNALETVANYFVQHKEAMWVTGKCVIVDAEEKTIQKYVTQYKNIIRTFFPKELLSVINYIDQPATFWRKQTQTEIGFFDPSLHLCLDYDYWLRIIQKYPLHYIPKYISAFRIHGQSKGKTQYQKQFNESYQVSSKYCHNPLLLSLNKFHNQITVLIYRIIKHT